MMCLTLMVSIGVPKAHVNAAEACGCANPMPRWVYESSFTDYIDNHPIGVIIKIIFEDGSYIEIDGSETCYITRTTNIFIDYCANCGTTTGEHANPLNPRHSHPECSSY
jgi:hypothetical protein